LEEVTTRKDLRGLGLTDSENYASRLKVKFNYQNTYFHREPRMDIAANLPPEKVGIYDFVTSSEIFEHVVPPVGRAFENAYRLLKPGGLLLLSVPYGTQPDTIEHFPELFDFTVAATDDHYVLTNRTREGVIQKFDKLVFHGGPGSTLEMRIFSESDLLRCLQAAGFTEARVRREFVFQYGIWWPQTWSWPVSARKPISDGPSVRTVTTGARSTAA